MDGIKGYKVFNPDWTFDGSKYSYDWEPDGTKYSCPGFFEASSDDTETWAGLTFCQNPADCFEFHKFDPNSHFTEVYAVGDVDRGVISSRTNRLLIFREIPWNEVLQMVNHGLPNAGARNTGVANTGGYNVGDCNTGDGNTGDINLGFYNTGDRNTGGRNSGFDNTGNHNAGDWNNGNYNAGEFNTGHYNTGDWNFSDHNTGCFMTEEQPIMLFNKPSNMTFTEWRCSYAHDVLHRIPKIFIDYISADLMTEQEKEDNPGYVYTGGFLQYFDYTKKRQEWWNTLLDCEQQAILAIPNFDAGIFKKCTGIDVGWSL